jgi:uncharacterized protein (DUF1697 family)
MPMNCKMADLKAAFEQAGFSDVKTVLASGNVLFTARSTATAALERKAEAAMAQHLEKSFLTIIRPVEYLRELLASDPYGPFRVSPKAKRIVTFLRGKPATTVKLPVEFEGARLLCLQGTELFSAYLPHPKAPVFMTLIQKTFGNEQTTRTWETVVKLAR